MNEKQVKETLDFLIEDYNFEYVFQEFESCPFGNWRTETYSYFNKYGCFTITKLVARDDVEYVHLDDIALLNKYMYSNSSEKIKSQIDITSVEQEIWKKHEKKCLFGKFFWGDKKYLNVLAEVIEVQIETMGQFFGIKV